MVLLCVLALNMLKFMMVIHTSESINARCISQFWQLHSHAKLAINIFSVLRYICHMLTLSVV